MTRSNVNSAALRSTRREKTNAGKNRLDLIPAEFILAVGEALTLGAEKYAERDWEKGLPWGCYYGALLRHVVKWHGGEDIDPESGKSHLALASACMAILVTYEARGIGTDDRPKGEQP